MIEIRDIVEADSAAFAALIIQLATESPYSLLTPAEAQQAAATQAERTQELLAAPQQTVFLALGENQPVGFIALSQGTLARCAHVCNLTLGVLAAYQGQGIGQQLLREGMAWARARNIQRIELGVMTENAKAIHLYEKFGFVIEGTRKSALKLEQGYGDEFLMAKYLLNNI